MNLHFTTILFIIFEHINKIFAQGIPISPCPKMFQYRFDGSEWFGILSVRSPDPDEPLHLRVTLSVRGKPATNYLGEIELLTRGQYLSDAPVLYKVKFPKSHLPPKLLQISVNNQVVCIGAADHGIFVTQIQLEHTRKFTFFPDQIQPSMQSSALGGLEGGLASIFSTVETPELPMQYTNIAFDDRHLPLANIEKNPMRLLKDVCGTIDDRIRFQVLDKLKQTRESMISSSPVTAFENPANNGESLLLSTLLARQNDEVSTGGKFDQTRDDRRNSKDEDVNDERLPLLVTIDPDADSESIFDDGSMSSNNLPSISRGAWPWLAAVYVNNLTTLAYQCSGTLLSTRVVISSAHCFHLFNQRFTANEVLVFLGRHNLKNWNEEGSLAAPVDDIFIHPEYNEHLNSYDADIAVVVLKNTVRFNTFIRPACIWTGSTQPKYIEGEHGIVIGWGLGRLNSTQQASTARLVPKIISAPIVSNDVCFQANPKYHSLSSKRTFCAGIMTHDYSTTTTKTGVGEKSLNFQHRLQQGPCTGDSGSGLMIFKNNRWMLRGTVSGLVPIQPSGDDHSTSRQSCSINQYVIYTDVAQFLDWILAFVI